MSDIKFMLMFAGISHSLHAANGMCSKGLLEMFSIEGSDGTLKLLVNKHGDYTLFKH